MEKTPPAPMASPQLSIAAFLQCTNLGGMEQVAYSLFEQLQPRGIQIKIATARTWGPGMSRALNIDPEIQSFPYRGRFGWRSFPRFQQHARALARSTNATWVVGACASCLAAARLTGRKILFSHHYHHFEHPASRLKWTAFYLAFGAGFDAITYPTDFTRREAVRIAPWLKSKMHVVRNGFKVHYTTEENRLADQLAARAELRLPADALLIGNAGWLIRRKRFDVFLHTAQRVSRRLPQARFYICGGGPEEENLKNLARDLGLADKVHFQGWVRDMAPYYRAWDVQLFNTDFDALGNTPLEAASHGCLCVASCRYGGLSEFLKTGQTGFLFEDHDADQLAAAVLRLAADPALALSLRQQAARLLQAEFSHEAALKFYEDYFRRHAKVAAP